MRIIFILFLSVYFLMAYEVVIKKVNGNEIIVDKYVKKGVSGIVLCPYEKREIICARAVLFGTRGYLKVYDDLENPAFALPVVIPSVNDKIILGKNYNRVMIIAPNQETYLRVKRLFKNKTFISPDIFAAFLDRIPTKKDFIAFAKKLDIGLYIFVLDKIYLVDSYSFYAIKKIDANVTEYKRPFYFSYNKKLSNGGIFSKFFSKNKINFLNYYKKMIKE